MDVQWGTCGDDDHWCDFNLLELPLSGEPRGVYMIWHEGNPGRVVYVGQGDISARIETHRLDPRITQYESDGTLRVTWATVPAWQRDGVERYLADQWNPLVGDVFPDADPIPVNSPWS